MLYDNYDMEENMRFSWLHARIKQMEEENSSLRLDIEKLDNKNLYLERNNACLKRQLGEDRERYNELQEEYNKLEVILNEVMEKAEAGKVALKESMTERKTLITKLEAVELEVQKIPSLREKLKKSTSEIRMFTKQVAEMTKTLDEASTKCSFLQKFVKELEEANESLQKICESRENMIQALRESNRELEDENVKLRLLSNRNTYLSADSDYMTSNLNTESYCDVKHTISLYDELKASGFSNTDDENNTIIRDLECQVHWYELEINKLLKETDGTFEQLGSIYDEERFRFRTTQNVDYNECSENRKNFETLKQRMKILLDMCTVTSSKIADIGTQLGADSRMIGNSREIFNSNNDVECGSNTGNEPIDVPTINQNCHEEVAPVQFDILCKDENFSPQMSPAIVPGSSQRPETRRKVSKKPNEEFTSTNVDSLGTMTPGHRRSKSDSNLITEKKFSSFLSHSCNVVITQFLVEKTSETAETKEKTISDSCTKKREGEYVEKIEEQNGLQNLTSWQEYKFRDTYRFLNDTTDSTCSTPSRHDNLLGLGDFSLNESYLQQQCKLCPVYLAPARLKRLPSNTPSIVEEKCVKDMNTGNPSTDIQLTDDCYDKRSTTPPSEKHFNFHILDSTAVHSTPIHIDLKDKNSCTYKRYTRLMLSNSSRRSSCRSLIRQFVDLNISNEISHLSSMHGECHLNKNDDTEDVGSVESTNTQNVPSVSNKEGTKDYIDAIRGIIHETSPNHENNMNEFEKSIHVNLPNMEESQNIFEKMEHSLEENNNVLQSNDWYTPSSMKSNDLLNDVRQNFYKKLTDSSKVEIVDAQQSCTPAVSHTTANSIFITPSWHTFISLALLFILGYYLGNGISLWNTSAEAPCTWYSFEEIFNRYFIIRNRQLRPL